MRLRSLFPTFAFFTFFLGLSLPTSSVFALDQAETTHLLNRLAFGPGSGDETRFLKLDRVQAVDLLLNEADQPAARFPLEPSWAEEPVLQRGSLSSKEHNDALQARIKELREFSVNLLLSAASPLREKMVLFWHNHFTTEAEKVKNAELLYRQDRTLRLGTLGNFASLLSEISRDPAMVLYLDNQSNHKGKPNENFARELFELFTLGEGHYSEADIKEAARAFTGWRVKLPEGQFRVETKLHDAGEKTVFGKTGPWDGDDIIDLVLKLDRTSIYLVEKLWADFVSPKLDQAEINRLASGFKASGYEIKPLLREMFLSDAFWAEKNRGTLIKSPVELLLSASQFIKTKQAAFLPKIDVVNASLRRTGQELFAPPNVKGWPGGEAWINSDTLLLRREALGRLLPKSLEKEIGATVFAPEFQLK